MSEYDEAAYKKFQLSGRILREAREEIKDFVREGMRIIDICERAEDLIRAKGARLAFPCNVSINEVAAHYTSPPDDEKQVPWKSVVKVDIGAHVDGYVTDTAVTVCFNPDYEDLVSTAERALKVAVENIKPGISASKLGGLIESTIKTRGFKPISNLSGHEVGRYTVHTGTSIPNVPQLSLTKIKLGSVYAIEPFVTLPDAAGRIEDGDESTIFRFVRTKSLKNPYAKQLLKHIEENFRTLPFAERWLKSVVPEERHQEAFHELIASRVLMNYPVFVEASRERVAQAEHTVMIVEGGCVVLT
jgi:methionyl aminopeptidase